MSALTCSLCGAPLPPPTDANRTVGCAYCGATSGVPDAPRPGGTFDAGRWQRAIEAFQALGAAGASPYQALVAAAREQLGPLGQTDVLARVVLALARDFDAEHGTSVARDATAMSRLIEGYAHAIEGMRAQGSHVIELQFFAATSAGPVHFRRKLSASDVSALAARDPNAAPPKKKWWPFG